jgi:hypothetical protein
LKFNLSIILSIRRKMIGEASRLGSFSVAMKLGPISDYCRADARLLQCRMFDIESMRCGARDSKSYSVSIQE